MMRVLMLAQKLDERDWLRAFIVQWVRGLAAHVEHVDVIALEVREAHLPQNVTVYSLGKERGKNRLRELAGFHRHMAHLAPRADVIFSHMTPRYVLLAAPYAARYRKRQVLWYVHQRASPQLKLAHALCWRVATAMPETFPIASPKIRALGHGIDTDFYAPANVPPQGGKGEERFLSLSPIKTEEFGMGDILHPILHVARLMPIKHQTTLIRAIARVPQARAVFVGDVPGGHEEYQTYADGLKSLAGELGVGERVAFTGGLLAPDVRDWYRRAALAVNLSPPGLFDKAALESMAAGVPTLVSSAAFDSLLGDDAPRLRLDSPDDVEGLAARLPTLLALPPEARARIGLAARERVVEAHSLTRLMPRLARLLETGEA